MRCGRSIHYSLVKLFYSSLLTLLMEIFKRRHKLFYLCESSCQWMNYTDNYSIRFIKPLNRPTKIRDTHSVYIGQYNNIETTFGWSTVRVISNTCLQWLIGQIWHVSSIKSELRKILKNLQKCRLSSSVNYTDFSCRPHKTCRNVVRRSQWDNDYRGWSRGVRGVRPSPMIHDENIHVCV